MKVNANTIRPGHVLDYKEKLCLVTKITMIQPGKGSAFIQIEMKDIHNNFKILERFRTQESVERVRVDEQEMQFLFADGDSLTFMDIENFDQILIDRTIIGDSAIFLQESMVCTVHLYEGIVIKVQLPSTVTLAVVATEPVIKRQTAASSYKPATLDNGIRVMVPTHIEVGMKIVINVDDLTYVERSKT